MLISHRGHGQDSDYLWVGFNSNEEWQTFLNLNARYPSGGYYIAGLVMVLSSQPLGFYIHPDTTQAAEVVAEGIVASIDAIKQEPAKYAESSFPTWAVPAKVERIAPSP